jgi:hypothetical protein
MFARFRRVESHLQVRLQVSVAESRRVAGRVRVEHIVALGSVGEPATIAERVAFWGNLHRRINALSSRISEDDRAKIIGTIYAWIPMVTVDEHCQCEHPSKARPRVRAELRLDVLNIGDAVYEIRNGTGVGVGAPQFGIRRAILAGLTQRF